jgi:hypothetical protein
MADAKASYAGKSQHYLNSMRGFQAFGVIFTSFGH